MTRLAAGLLVVFALVAPAARFVIHRAWCSQRTPRWEGSSVNGSRAIIGFLVCALLSLASPSRAAGINHLVNGDFEAGVAGFETDLQRNTVSGWDAGVFDVRDNPDDAWHPLFVNTGDHTSGSGLMMVVNGSDVSGQTVYRQRVHGLTAGESLLFSGFFLNLCCEGLDRPASSLSVWWDGLEVAPVTLALAGLWTEVSVALTALDTFGDLEIRNSSTVFSGNDSAFDDFRLTSSPVPEPASMFLLGTGLLGMGHAVRRQRAQRRA